jgi:hypothetical protein
MQTAFNELADGSLLCGQVWSTTRSHGAWDLGKDKLQDNELYACGWSSLHSLNIFIVVLY